jgi:peptidoglycan/xylan/chitin deacetylase (PgdA/CDA1 family)
MRTLMYHDIASRARQAEVGFGGPLASRYKLEPDAFEAHLDALAATGLRVGTLDANESPPQLLLSFDDGGSSALLAAEALERRGWHGQFFITTGRLGTPGFLSAEELRELARRGHAIGGHSHTHPTYMGRLSREELDREWARSRDVIGEILGAPPRTASVPGGYLSRAVIASAAAAGYELLFTSEPTARVAHDELVVRGRYTIWATTPARVAAAYASGRRLACGRLWLEWNTKKLAKRASPAAYQALRRLRARRT